MHIQLSEHAERSLEDNIGADKRTEFICEYFMKADNILGGLEPGTL
jgi:hypothetical protein